MVTRSKGSEMVILMGVVLCLMHGAVFSAPTSSLGLNANWLKSRKRTVSLKLFHEDSIHCLDRGYHFTDGLVTA